MNYSIVLEPLGPRDPYGRDPYYERRPDPYMDRRDYSRERESYREKLPSEYERDRYERERYPPRERDDRYAVSSVALTSFSPNWGSTLLPYICNGVFYLSVFDSSTQSMIEERYNITLCLYIVISRQVCVSLNQRTVFDRS